MSDSDSASSPIARYFTVLDVIAAHREGATLSEIVAATEASKEGVYLDSFFDELGQASGKPVPLSVDNTGARALSYNPEFHDRTKHILRKHFWIRESVEDGRIEVPYVNTADNLADFFTKPLPSRRFFDLRDRIMNHDPHDRRSAKQETEDSDPH